MEASATVIEKTASLKGVTADKGGCVVSIGGTVFVKSAADQVQIFFSKSAMSKLENALKSEQRVKSISEDGWITFLCRDEIDAEILFVFARVAWQALKK